MMQNNFQQNYGGNPLLPVSGEYQTERQRFQIALQQLEAAVFGKNPTNLVIWLSEPLLAYWKFLEIGAQNYPTTKERHLAILRGLSAAEFFLAIRISNGQEGF